VSNSKHRITITSIVPIDRLLRFEGVVPYQAMLFTVAANLSDPKHIVMISTLKKQQQGNGKGVVWNERRAVKARGRRKGSM
jgi:hypothetical protein